MTDTSATPRMYLYDFPSPDNPDEIIHDWTADTLEEAQQVLRRLGRR